MQLKFYFFSPKTTHFNAIFQSRHIHASNLMCKSEACACVIKSKPKQIWRSCPETKYRKKKKNEKKKESTYRKKNEQSLQLLIANIIVAATNKTVMSLPLMNSFNKTKVAFFPCRLCFLRAFLFISFIYKAWHNNTI